MFKHFSLLIATIIISTAALAQKNKSEIHLSPGLEFTIKDAFKSYENLNGNQPAFAFQLSYQLLFNHVGFNVSLEFMKRNIELSTTNQFQEFESETGQIRGDRFMLYFVGRAGKENSNLSFDLRFGLGKLLQSKEYHFRSPINLLHEVIPGLSFATGVKVNYKLSRVIALYLDSKVSFIPYNYRINRDHIWYQVWETRSSYLLDLGFYVGINILLNSKKVLR